MNRIISLLLLILTALVVFADDEAQTELRLNPQIERNEAEARRSYPFLHLRANRIDLNGADWSRVRERYAASRDSGVFSVVYLGDSHVQADFGGAVLRSRLAGESASAGRGLVIPFRLTGSNQPADYNVRLHSDFLSAKMMKMPWAVEMPFTGVGIRPSGCKASFDISSDEPFSELKLHYRGETPAVNAVRDLELGMKLDFELADSMIRLSRPTHRLLLELDRADRTVFGGFELLNGKNGIVTHSLGNNGATYSAYANIDRFGSQFFALHPDLVIIALGTNEAFGTFDEDTFENDIASLVDNIRRHNPMCEILLVSPAECYRRVYRRRKGRRRRSSSLVVNTRIARVRNVISRYAHENGIPFYDTYAVAGGAGAAARMKAARVLGSDGVHYTAAGYRLWGTLLSDALVSVLDENENR